MSLTLSWFTFMTGLRVIAGILLLFILRLACWAVYIFLVGPITDPLRRLPGPEIGFWESHLTLVIDPSFSGKAHQDWTEKYGKTLRFHGIGKFDYRLISFDFRVLQHVLNSPIYEKPRRTRNLLESLLQNGIFTREGAEHKLQRRIIGPAFTAKAVESMSPIFNQKAKELCDVLLEQTRDTKEVKVNIMHWVSRATFDAFGIAGFNYDFHALQGESDELYLAFRRLFSMAEKRSLLYITFPFLAKIIPDEFTLVARECLNTIHSARHRIFMAKKATILDEKLFQHHEHGRDLLSLLIKSNISEDPSKRLCDSDLLDQLSSFIFAGSDTTTSGITFAIHHLVTDLTLQKRLHDEIIGQDEEDSWAAMPLLHAIVMESLRLNPPVHSTLREATSNDNIPLSAPITLRDGTTVESISIRKGSSVHIPIEGLNTSTEIWGDDAAEFRPSRWLSELPPKAQAPAHPGLANVMSFSFGPHSCPGWRFAILEIKTFLAHLLREFELFPGSDDVGKYNGIVMRPFDRHDFPRAINYNVIVRKIEK